MQIEKNTYLNSVLRKKGLVVVLIKHCLCTGYFTKRTQQGIYTHFYIISRPYNCLVPLDLSSIANRAFILIVLIEEEKLFQIF